MKKQIVDFKVSQKNLTIVLNDGEVKKLVFPFDIGQVEKFDDVLVARLEVPAGVVFKENVFGVSSDGEIVWQIAPVKSAFKYSWYTGLFRKGDKVKIGNLDGNDFLLEPKTGKILERNYSK